MPTVPESAKTSPAQKLPARPGPPGGSSPAWTSAAAASSPMSAANWPTAKANKLMRLNRGGSAGTCGFALYLTLPDI
ncbi:hypothetical protein ACFU9W_47685 [Streptomyces sp. NPDC057600]|uniref:hypothetical protein n=1 Tax=Streptomyces sp. NPDC057600 TaxID=3346180 RepID=UPI0036CFB81A